jgi:hypothetical protein
MIYPTSDITTISIIAVDFGNKVQPFVGPVRKVVVVI